MAEARSDTFGDVINLLAAPLAGGLRTVDQVRRAVDELLRAIENLNTTLESVNEVAQRANRLLADIEGPLREMVPKATRTISRADEVSALFDTPLRAAAPNIERVFRMLSSANLANVPTQIDEFLALMTDMSKRLGPLTTLAESAGGLFGGFKMPGASPAPTSPTSGKAATPKPKTTKPAAKKAAAKKPAAKRVATRVSKSSG